MPFCSSCGSEVQGKFCPKCGAPAGGVSAGNPPPGPTSAAAPAAIEENVAAALCYLVGVLTGILFLVLAPYNTNKTTRFHAFQSIFFAAATIVAFIVLIPLSFVLLVVPWVGAAISIVIHLAVYLGVFILWLMLMYKAYNRELWVLPVIGPLAQKQA